MPEVEIGKNEKGEYAIKRVSCKTGGSFFIDFPQEYETIGILNINNKGTNKDINPGKVSKEYVKSLLEKQEECLKLIKDKL